MKQTYHIDLVIPELRKDVMGLGVGVIRRMIIDVNLPEEILSDPDHYNRLNKLAERFRYDTVHTVVRIYDEEEDDSLKPYGSLT